MKKTCNRCNVEKDIGEYYKNSKRTYPYCKECARSKYAQKHYKDNKTKYKLRSKSRSQKLKIGWREFKSQFKCSKCAEERWWVLDFHHLNKELKEGLLTDLFYNSSRDMFEKELAKCIPLCRNCHADLHFWERENKNTGKVLR